VSTIPLCICAGTLFGGFLAEKIGNLWNLRISLLMELFGWLIIYFSQSFTVLMTGRILTGLGAGFSTPSTYLMLTDLSLVRFRGIMAVLNSSSANLGWLVGLILGRFCPLNLLIFTYSLPAAIFILISVFLPESPLWLTKHGQDDMAKKALEIVRGPKYPIQVEAKELLACVEAARPESGSRCTQLKKQIEFYATTREFIIPMSIMLFLSIIQGACGCDTISYYSLTIFRKAKISLDEYLMSIFLQIGYTAGYLFVSPVMEKINRKHLFIIASISMSSALTLLASCLPNSDGLDEADNIEDGAIEVSTPLYVQIILPMAVVAFSFCYGAGFGPAVYTWSSELFPPRGRTLGCSVSLSIRHIVVACILKIYPWMLHSLGLAHLFGFHAITLIIGAFFVTVFVPETRGLTLTQLATLFGGKINSSKQNNEMSTSSSSEEDETKNFLVV